MQTIQKESPINRNSKPAGKCIFCGGIGLSKEHLFADWLRTHFPRTASDTHTYGKIIKWGEKPKFLGQKMNGHSGSRKVRKVCLVCNNGWISGIDEAAKKVAIPLIQGASTNVTPDIQAKLATWLAKIAMVGDAVHKKNFVLPRDREWIKATLCPPILWEVWIGSYEGNDWRDLALFQHSGILNLSSVTGSHHFTSNVQATTIGIGKMIALVVGSTNPALPLRIGSAASVLTRIWPKCNSFAWPTNHILSDREVSGISKILNSATAHPIKINYGP